MRISSFNINYKQHSAKQNFRVHTNTFLARNNGNILNADKFVLANRPDLSSQKKYYNVPISPIFTGNALKQTMRDFLRYFGSERYGIRLFDKEAGQEISAFVNYTPVKKALSIHSFEEPQVLGGVDIEPCSLLFCVNDGHESFEVVPYTVLYSLENRSSQHVGIGQNLIQAVIEMSLRTEDEGRIFLRAHNNLDKTLGDPFVFYKKMGFTMKGHDNETPDLYKYINRAAWALNPPTKRERLIHLIKDEEAISLSADERKFLELLQELRGQDFASLPVDEQMLAIYQTIAHHKHCTMDEIHLDFNEKMFLNKDVVNTFWTPRIQANRIFSDKNRLE